MDPTDEVPVVTEVYNVDLSSYDHFLRLHKLQLEKSAIPAIYWPALHRKLAEQTYDAGDYFMMFEHEDQSNGWFRSWEVQVSKEEGISLEDPNCIVIADHAWTYRLEDARKHLESHQGIHRGLAERMCQLMNGLDDVSMEDIIQNGRSSPNAQSLSAKPVQASCMPEQTSRGPLSNEEMTIDLDRTAEEEVPIWYILDEFASRFQHSDNPSVAITSIFYYPRQLAYSVIYPLRSMACAEQATCDYALGISDPLLRSAQLYPWYPERFDEHLVVDSWEDSLRRQVTDVPSSMDDLADDLCRLQPKELQLPLKVCSADGLIRKHLTDSRFVLVESASEADILWCNTPFHGFADLEKNGPKYVNQFPGEKEITVKDLLAVTAMRTLFLDGHSITHAERNNRGPLWLPTTYILTSELPQFIKRFREQERRGLPNIWIIKTWNLTRAVDTVVTGNLAQIIRLTESAPKVACRYIDRPVLFSREVGRVKFDFRYVILLRSTQPLQLYAYKVFWLRFANKPFSLDEFDVYEKHFTVMNYCEAELKQIDCEEFVPMFESQYPGYKWDLVEKEVFQLLVQLFRSSLSVPEEIGLGRNRRVPPDQIIAAPQ